MSELLYELKDLSHGFGSGIALDGISARIDSGGCLGLVGCNGAGKSTLLYLLAGLMDPLQGTLTWREHLISSRILAKDKAFRTNFRRNVGIVFQDPDAQFLCDSVREEISYGPLQLWEAAEADSRVMDAVQVMGLSHLAQQPPYALSGGEKRRVALASVIAMDPDVLLLDEPTSSLDAATTDFLVDWLEGYSRREGKTLIMATHDLALLADLADRCLVLTPCHRVAAYDETAAILQNDELLRQMNLQGRRRSTQRKA